MRYSRSIAGRRRSGEVTGSWCARLLPISLAHNLLYLAGLDRHFGIVTAAWLPPGSPTSLLQPVRRPPMPLFTATIRNRNTRLAYSRAYYRFFHCCQKNGKVGHGPISCGHLRRANARLEAHDQTKTHGYPNALRFSRCPAPRASKSDGFCPWPEVSCQTRLNAGLEP